MATLVLTAVGTAIGGPIGGAIGALLGGPVDTRLLGSTREGARLTDLKVQTSAYGTAIPKLFGTLRVAGTVIWATDLREDRHTTRAGKGGAKTASYSYSASFAVALSGRPIRAVHRIWADGKLLRGAAGDWKSETGFRLYPGDEAQGIDPLIASAEGIGDCPAYRGTAYALFEDMQLADYGNRIPSLTFEVEADAAAVPLGAIAAALGGAGVAGGAALSLDGYAASGSSVRGALETLAEACPLRLVDDGAVLRVVDAAGAVTVIAPDELGASADGRAEARRAIERIAAGTLPDEVSIAYYEPAREYQAGLQRARRGGPALRSSAIELAAALAAGAARGLAEAKLSRLWCERTRATARLPWARMGLRPGERVTLPGEAGTWRVTRVAIEGMAVVLTLVRDAPAPVRTAPAVAGRSTAGDDARVGETRVRLVDLPPLDDAAETAPRLWVAAAGTAAGWRRAALSLSLDGGASWSGLGQTAAPATLGIAVTALAAGDAVLIDRARGVTVELAHDGMALVGASEAALIGGANAALLGDELIQFGEATQIGARRWRLSRLLRGRRGSEGAIGPHGVGEDFLLIEPAALLPVSLSPALLGRGVRVSALGVGDATAVIADAVARGRAVRPPCPVRLTARRRADGALRLGWTRRSRAGWAWLDGIDAPLGEESERYRLTLADDAGAILRTAEPTQPWFDYAAADRLADGVGAALTLSVAQTGSIAPSDPAVARFIIEEISL